MKRATQTYAWLNAVKAAPRLRRSIFVVAFQLTQKISTAEFEISGRLITWQSIPLLAVSTGLGERAVRYAIRRLEATGYLSITTGGGRKRSNHYTLTLPETLQARAGFSEAETLQNSTVNPARIVPKPCTRVPPNLLKKDSLIFPDKREADPRGPRLRADALGPHTAGLRKRLAERWEWLDCAKLAGHSSDTVTLAVVTLAQGDNIRKHCEADILAEFGVTRLEFVQMQVRP